MEQLQDRPEVLTYGADFYQRIITTRHTIKPESDEIIEGNIHYEGVDIPFRIAAVDKSLPGEPVSVHIGEKLDDPSKKDWIYATNDGRITRFDSKRGCPVPIDDPEVIKGLTDCFRYPMSASA